MISILVWAINMFPFVFIPNKWPKRKGNAPDGKNANNLLEPNCSTYHHCNNPSIAMKISQCYNSFLFCSSLAHILTPLRQIQVFLIVSFILSYGYSTYKNSPGRKICRDWNCFTGEVFAYSEAFGGKWNREGRKMKEDEKKLPNWEMVDPKPPVIQSGHFENRKQH